MNKFLLTLYLLSTDPEVRCVPHPVAVQVWASADSLLINIDGVNLYALVRETRVNLASGDRGLRLAPFTLWANYSACYLMRDERDRFFVHGGFNENGFLLFLTNLRTKRSLMLSSVPCKLTPYGR